jgi:acyl-coenzyme A synthetase/AMP-(fatty) acid ligase
MGDLVQIDPTGICECGRNDGYICKEFAGRTADFTYTTNNYPVTTAMVESIMNNVESVAEYQVVQREGIYNVNIVLDENADASNAIKEEIIEGLLPLYGRDAVINVNFVTEIETEPSGKYRLTRSDIPVNTERLFMKGN